MTRNIVLLTVFLTIGIVAGFSIFISITRNSGDAADASAVEEATIVSVLVSEEEIGVGEECTISIAVEPSKAIAGMQFDLSFDPALVSINSVKEGDLLKQDGASTYFNPGTIDNEQGTISDVYSAITSPGEMISEDGIFVTITLTAGSTNATCHFNLSNVIVGDIEGNSVPVTIVNDELEIG